MDTCTREMAGTLNDYEVITCCRLCGAERLAKVLDFGCVPLANSYPLRRGDEEAKYPLSVAKCESCGHVQLEQTIAPGILFNDYLYSSSDSPSLVKHLGAFAMEVATKLNIKTASGILEIGCNDGILLKHFSALGFVNLVGIDPASNLTRKAESTGATIIPSYFTEDRGGGIRFRHGPMKLVCATNAFAHLADIEGVVLGIRDVLAKDGVFVFENAYLLDTVQNLYFDQVYHEHLQYFAVKPLVSFFKQFDMEVFAVQHLDSQGGSIRVFVKRANDDSHLIEDSVAQFVRQEEEALLFDSETYNAFKWRMHSYVLEFQAFIDKLLRSGHTFSCYGCPAKFTLLSNVLKLGNGLVEYVVDDSPLKQGRFTPGQQIPIVDNVHFRTHPTDCCIVSAWNMADAIVRRNPEYRGRWIKPLPKPMFL